MTELEKARRKVEESSEKLEKAATEYTRAFEEHLINVFEYRAIKKQEDKQS